MLNIIQKADLYFCEGSSDKEYHLQLCEDGGDFTVTFQYGRRGSALLSGTKVVNVARSAAEKAYNKVLNEKLGKGYQEVTSPTSVSPDLWPVHARATTPPPSSTAINSDSLLIPVPKRKIQIDSPQPVLETSSAVSFIPQLLNEISEDDIETYLRDDRYGSQEKMDGHHQALHQKSNVVSVTNKKGKLVEMTFPPTLGLASDLLIDSEKIGDVFHAFDLLERNGVDLRNNTYRDRYEKLKILTPSFSSTVKVVPLAIGYTAKKAMYDKLKKEKKEGIVFKLLDAPYTPGKAHSAMWKCKFYAELSAVVCAGREGKRSMGVKLLKIDGSGSWQFMGNVTIPPNKEVPAIGSVVEIRYLYVKGVGGHLYQPFYKEPRNDVDEIECNMSQVKYKAEED